MSVYSQPQLARRSEAEEGGVERLITPGATGGLNALYDTRNPGGVELNTVVQQLNNQAQD